MFIIFLISNDVVLSATMLFYQQRCCFVSNDVVLSATMLFNQMLL